MAKATSTKKTAVPAEAPKKKPAPAAPTGKSWHTDGTGAYEDKKKEDKQRAAMKEKWGRRFYLRAESKTKSLTTDRYKDYEARLVFLDSPGFAVYEHRVVPGGDWTKTAYVTCTKDFDPPCSVCQAVRDSKPTRTVYYTAIDLRQYPKDDGTVSKFRRVLFPAKGDAIGEIEKLKEAHGSLDGLAVDVRRVGEKSSNCGSHFAVAIKDGKVIRVKDPVSKFGPEQGVPMDYMKILAPWTAEQLETLGIRKAKAAGSSEDVSEDLEEEDTEATEEAETSEGTEEDDDEVVDLD